SLVAGTSNNYFTIVGAGGDDTVDASAVVNTPLVFAATSGVNNLKGGGGNDAFVFFADQLTAADTVTGGLGADVLYFKSSGIVASDAFTNVTGIDAVVTEPTAGNSMTLTDAMVSSAEALNQFIILGGAGADVVDASAV